MDDLIAFLKTRCDEDAQTATAGARLGESWYVDDESGEVAAVQANPLPGDGLVLVTCDTEGLTPSVEEGEAAHIARHDPARVLREVEAKRRLLDFHLPEPLNEWDRKSYGFTLKCAGESWECYGDGEDIVPWPCDHLKLLALPYADHPDYQETWKP